MFDVFPRSDYKRIEDTTWIPRVTEWGWVILAKDSFRKPHEQRAIIACAARVFSLPHANMTSEAMTLRFLANEERIRERCRDSGPFHYSLSDDRMRPVELRDRRR
jgi:hypothetical protein